MDIKEEVKKKRKGKVPLFYLVTTLCIIAYSAISNTMLYFSKDIEFILNMNKLNLNITYAWILYNAVLLVYAFIKKYKWEWKTFCAYYLFINLLNIYVLKNFNLFWLNIGLKVIEVMVITYLIAKKEFS